MKIFLKVVFIGCATSIIFDSLLLTIYGFEHHMDLVWFWPEIITMIFLSCIFYGISRKDAIKYLDFLEYKETERKD